MSSQPGKGISSLRDIRVLDLTRNLAGPYCTMILGDMGADVIKIEHPLRGDDTRDWAPPTWNGESTTFLSANRNKRSLALDINLPEGIEIVRSLAKKADILVESFRPGSLDKRGLGYKDLKKENEGLIYCSISAYGNAGPLRDSPGYDPILQASSGILDMTGEPDQDPVRLPLSVMDLGAGMWAVIGLLSALRERQSTGHGSLVETSLFETAAWWLNYHMVGFLGTGNTPTRQGTGTPFIAPYEVFPAADEGVLVCAGNDSLFRSFMELLEMPELGEHEHFLTNPLRVKNRLELRKRIIEKFQSRPAAEWVKLMQTRAIPCSRIHTVADFTQNEQMQSLGLLTNYPHPLIPDLRLVDMPMSQDQNRAAHQYSPPLLGEHTDTILFELGYSEEDVAALDDKGVISRNSMIKD
ncbi:MAG: CoA transferase [Chloroflexi bacterium]|nr:CoA transferase [Chloroflexota bacterium]